MSRDPYPPRHSDTMLTKVLAVLLLLVAGALVVTVVLERHHDEPKTVFEPRPVAQRPDDKLGADEANTIKVFKEFSRSVVHVTSLATRRDQMTMDVTEIPQGVGSGFIWDEDGHIVTNYHVVREGDRASVTLNDNSTYAAKIVGVAPDKDIAVLQIDAPRSKLRKLPVGKSDSLQVGQKVLAIGNPFGLDQTLTTGVISGLGREIKAESGRTISDVIQTDASINPGNSGGPLLDSAGRLIGINTAIYSPSGANAGIGFAVPVDTVNAIVPQLLQYGKIIRPGLGLNLISDQVAQQNGVDGAIIYTVVSGGAADKAGIKGLTRSDTGIQMGDVIVRLDGTDIHKAADLYRVLDAHKVGDTIDVTLENRGQRRTVKVELQQIP